GCPKSSASRVSTAVDSVRLMPSYSHCLAATAASVPAWPPKAMASRHPAASQKLDEPLLAAIGDKSQPLIKRERARVVEGAGVDKEFRNRLRPGVHRRMVEEEISKPPADVFRDQAEVGDVRQRRFPEIEFRHARRASIGIEDVEFVPLL